MEPQNVSAEANSDADAVLVSNTVQADAVSETATGSVVAGSTTEGVSTAATIAESSATEPKPSYVKLAMRNMVRKRGLSLWHFALTTVGLLAFLVGLSYVTR